MLNTLLKREKNAKTAGKIPLLQNVTIQIYSKKFHITGLIPGDYRLNLFSVDGSKMHSLAFRTKVSELDMPIPEIEDSMIIYRFHGGYSKISEGLLFIR